MSAFLADQHDAYWPPEVTLQMQDLIVDTTGAPVPLGDDYAAAMWLAGRHASFPRILAKVPDAVVYDERDDARWIEISDLFDAFTALDSHRRGISIGLDSLDLDVDDLPAVEQAQLRLLAALYCDRLSIDAASLALLDPAVVRDFTEALTARHTAPSED